MSARGGNSARSSQCISARSDGAYHGTPRLPRRVSNGTPRPGTVLPGSHHGGHHQHPPESGGRSGRSNGIRQLSARNQGGEHPGMHSGRMNSSRGNGQLVPQHSARSNSVPSVRPNHFYFPEVGNFTLTAVPGYGGHIPGKISENVISSTYNRSNQLAAVQCEERLMDDHDYAQQPRNLAMHNPFGVSAPHRRGTDIPGYQGFVPGKYADGVFGHVYARANNISQLLKQRQYADKVAWLDKIYN